MALNLASIPFSPSQPLIIEEIDLTKHENEKGRILILSILNECFPNQRCSLKTWAYLNGDIHQYLDMGKLYGRYVLKPKNENELVLTDTFTYDAEEFRWRLCKLGKIVVPPNQVLRILDESFDTILDEYVYLAGDHVKKHPQDDFKTFGEINIQDFLLNQILLLAGHSVEIDFTPDILKSEKSPKELQDKNLVLTLHHKVIDGKILELYSDLGFSLSATRNALTTYMFFLSRQVVSSNLPEINIAANQQLQLFIADHSLVEEYLAKKDEWLVFKKILESEEPFGFKWHFGSSESIFHLEIQKRATMDNELLFYTFNISAKAPITFILAPTSVEEMAEQMAKKSSPQFREKLLEADSQALIFLTFRLMFYCCCRALRAYPNTQILNMLQPETRQKILNLVARDGTHFHNEAFAKALSKMISDPHLNQRLKSIGDSLEVFGSLDLKKEDESIQVVVGCLRELAYKEIQGSAGFLEFIKMVIKKSEEMEKK